MLNESTQTKACSKCAEVKPLDEFSPNRRASDGRQPSCKACCRTYRAANRERVAASQAKYYLANREKIRARQRDAHDPERVRAYYLANRDRIRRQQKQYNQENLAAKKARDAEYRAANREKIRAYQIAYSEANREKARREAKKWMRNNPERVAEIQRRRRARKRGSVIGPVDVEALWTGSCGICNEPMDRTLPWPHPRSPSIDHIVPLARGGAHVQDNLRWTCLVCNLRKGPRLDP